jgi:hypothetical protein
MTSDPLHQATAKTYSTPTIAGGCSSSRVGAAAAAAAAAARLPFSGNMQGQYNPYGVMPDPYGGSYNPYMAPPPPPGYMMPPGSMQHNPTAPYAVPGMPSSTGAPLGAPPGMHGGEEPRTVFITGFPPDVKERELNNMLRFVPGYEASQMNWKNGQARHICALYRTNSSCHG